MPEMFFRVHEDTANRDLSAGQLYNQDFEPATLEDVRNAGQDVLISPVTPDTFDMLLGAHEMGADVNISVDLTDPEQEP